jgi:pyruvate formate lyase activating enzyme
MNIRNSQCKQILDGIQFTKEEEIGKMMTVNELIHEIKKDSIFYEESNGGVTFSGGEPAFQPEFLGLIIAKCKEEGIHTTIDTCGYTSTDVLKNIISRADLILYDLKHMDNKMHMKYTGVPNIQILENLKWLDRNEKNVIIRFPVIPKINDNKENTNKMFEFMSHLAHIKKISLLPYHTIAMHKYERLNKTNKMDGIKAMMEEDLYELKVKFEKIGFNVQIGN